jgi:hypothetical protein
MLLSITIILRFNIGPSEIYLLQYGKSSYTSPISPFRNILYYLFIRICSLIKNDVKILTKLE